MEPTYCSRGVLRADCTYGRFSAKPLYFWGVSVIDPPHKYMELSVMGNSHAEEVYMRGFEHFWVVHKTKIKHVYILVFRALLGVHKCNLRAATGSKPIH